MPAFYIYDIMFVLIIVKSAIVIGMVNMAKKKKKSSFVPMMRKQLHEQ